MLAISTNGPANVSFSGGIAIQDASGVQFPLSKIIPLLTASMSASTFGQASLGTSPAVVTLPANPTQLLYAKNLSTTNSITFTWTPAGVVSVEVLVLQPGGVIFFFSPSGGISALTVVANAAGTPVDYLLAG
jgi:hypothetical protein